MIGAYGDSHRPSWMDSRRSVHFAFLAFEKLGYSQLRSESTNVTALIFNSRDPSRVAASFLFLPGER